MPQRPKTDINQKGRLANSASSAPAREVTLALPAAHPSQHDFITSFDRDPELRFIVGACGTKFASAPLQ